MSKELQIFNNPEFGIVRVVEIDNEPWFVAKDISDFLNYSDASAMTRHLDEDEKANCQIDSMSKGQIIINESGLYSAILRSKRPEAKKFKKWVTSEVLPSIRKHGAYMTDATIEKALTSPDFLIRLATELKEEQIKRRELEKKNKDLIIQNSIQNQVIAEYQPKAEYFDALVDRNLLTNIRDTAKELGVKERLFSSWLVQKKFCYRDSKNKLKPYASWMKYFKLKEFATSYHSDVQTLVNPKGREAFRLLLIKDGLLNN